MRPAQSFGMIVLFLMQSSLVVATYQPFVEMPDDTCRNAKKCDSVIHHQPFGLKVINRVNHVQTCPVMNVW
jgi:hypothetical protein